MMAGNLNSLCVHKRRGTGSFLKGEALEDGSFQSGKDAELVLFLPVLRLWFLSMHRQRRLGGIWIFLLRTQERKLW